MQVRLIAVTQPIPGLEDGLDTPMDLISYCARVSNPSNQLNTGTADKLIGYLIRNAHWSPFEMVSAVVEVKETRDITRQLLRHRSFSFQEFSQRYAVITEMKPAIREARLQDVKNRQNSVEIQDTLLQDEWEVHQRTVWAHAIKAYQWALDKGIAKEVARAVLPEGLTMSHLYVHGTIRSWIHYLQLRTGNGTQKEHILMARAIAEVIAKSYPIVTQQVK
jgi:thymidylate synthase (FAD)